MNAKDIFDKAILLQDGETLIIPCINYNQQESLRVSLANQRKTFLDKADTEFDILISKVRRNKQYFVSISKVRRIKEAVLIKQDGSEEIVSLAKPREEESLPIDIARMIAKMREDGMSEEEIREYFNK